MVAGWHRELVGRGSTGVIVGAAPARDVPTRVGTGGEVNELLGNVLVSRATTRVRRARYGKTARPDAVSAEQIAHRSTVIVLSPEGGGLGAPVSPIVGVSARRIAAQILTRRRRCWVGAGPAGSRRGRDVNRAPLHEVYSASKVVQKCCRARGNHPGDVTAGVQLGRCVIGRVSILLQDDVRAWR